MRFNRGTLEFEEPPRGCFVVGIDDIIIGSLIAGAVGLGTSALGASKQASADNAAAAARQAAFNRFSGLQGAEFNRRQAEQDASRARIGGIRTEALRNETGLAKSNLAERLALRARYDQSGTGAKLTTADRIGDIYKTRNEARDAATLQGGAYSAAEQGNQDAYQSSATKIASDVARRMGVTRTNADVKQAASGRTALIDSTVDTGVPQIAGLSDYGQADLAKRVAGRVGLATDSAKGLAGVSAYQDAGGVADRFIGRAGERGDILARKATDSRAALDPELAAARVQRENADKDAETRKANAQEDLHSYVTMLDQGQQQETGRVEDRQKAVSDLMDKFYSGEIQTEEDFINAIVASSANYEDAMQALFNFQIGGTYGRSTFGQILSGAGSSLTAAGINRALA